MRRLIVRNNPDDLSNQLVSKIKKWLQDEIASHWENQPDQDVDSREIGILDGRYECARGLITQIKKWENDYE